VARWRLDGGAYGRVAGAHADGAPAGRRHVLIFVLGPAAVQETGWLYVLFPACFAACVMVACAFVFNRAVGRTYPQYWW